MQTVFRARSTPGSWIGTAGGGALPPALSLLGMPPLLGFFGKLYLFAAGIGAGEIGLVVVMGLNSAIAAYYYLRLAGAALLEEPSPGAAGGAAGAGAAPGMMRMGVTSFPGRVVAGLLSAASVIALVPAASWLIERSDEAGRAMGRGESTAEATTDASELTGR